MTDLFIDNLSLSYGNTVVLRGITVPALPPRALVGVLGPNGAGKSTFLRALAGLGGYTGSATLDGEDLGTMPFHRRTGKIGYLPQSLPQGTTLIAYEAVISACRAVRPDLPRPAIETMVEDIFDLLSIRHLAFKALNTLSGGQRQMVGLAQVVVRKPALLLLDEPTSALDLRWQINVFEVVRSVQDQQDGICLMAMHDLNLALRHCDHVLLFGQGRVISCGAPNRAITPEHLRNAYQIDGRVEVSSTGIPFVIPNGIARELTRDSDQGTINT